MKHAISLAALALVFAPSMKNAPQFSPGVDYGDVLSYDPSEINAPGTEVFIYFCPRADFLVLQDVGAVTTIDDLGVVAAAHTFTAPKGWHKLLVQFDQNSVQHELAGDGGGSKNSARFFMKGNAAEIRGIVNQMNNDDCIYLIPLKDGTVAQIGSKFAQAKAKANFDSKTDSQQSDPRGWEVMVECFDKYSTYYDSSLAITLHS